MTWQGEVEASGSIVGNSFYLLKEYRFQRGYCAFFLLLLFLEEVLGQLTLGTSMPIGWTEFLIISTIFLIKEARKII